MQTKVIHYHELYWPQILMSVYIQTYSSTTKNSYIYNKYKKQLQKIERKVGMPWSTKKHTNKGSKDGNKGQGSSLLLFVLNLWLIIYQALQIVFE